MAKTTLQLWINGQRTASCSKRFGDVYNPASGEIIRQVPLANREDMEIAIAVAKAAFPAWLGLHWGLSGVHDMARHHPVAPQPHPEQVPRTARYSPGRTGAVGQ